MEEIFHIGEGIRPLVHNSFSLLNRKTLCDFMKFLNELLSRSLSIMDGVMSKDERNAELFAHGANVNSGIFCPSEELSISPLSFNA